FRSGPDAAEICVRAAAHRFFHDQQSRHARPVAAGLAHCLGAERSGRSGALCATPCQGVPDLGSGALDRRQSGQSGLSMDVADKSGAGPGAWLAAAREQAGWSLIQAAERLHLDVAAVKALEAGDYRTFGAPVYARGHLRRYAELVGLSAHDVEQAF